MKKTKLNIIKLNILTTTLTLICISCAVNKIDPKPKSKTSPKENTKEFENKSQDLEPSKEQNKDLGPLREKHPEATASKLETTLKILEAQKEKENTEIAKIANTQIDFLKTFKTDPHDSLPEDEKMQMKKIIYSSLNYEKQQIETLKEILEKLNKNLQHKKIAKNFIYDIPISIQSRLDIISKVIKKPIKDELQILNQKEIEELLMRIESELKIKENFAKKLNKTIDAYNQNSENIKTNAEQLAKHINENYKEFNSLKPIY
ncbi:complement regulator-acquiring protein [Borreliella garinii]|uniref:complement regulator-acquiring protein n=1 Tax=Borreliella garinii TaxID=29519 RepID=UPI0003F62291|nr:complement regulator-acquiring protein [Borreliella garinii]APQ15623.1 regulator [Borreliella garinii]AZA28285.1 regulator [Borreliella garinii]